MIKINNVEIAEEAFKKIAEQYGYVKQTRNKRWRVEEGRIFYSMSVDGILILHLERLDKFCDILYLSGNYFKTEVEAQAYWGRMLARQRVIDRLREIEGDWKLDWTLRNNNCIAYYCHMDNSLQTMVCSVYQDTDSSHYSSKEACEQVIEEIPDDIKLMLGVIDA